MQKHNFLLNGKRIRGHLENIIKTVLEKYVFHFVHGYLKSAKKTRVKSMNKNARKILNYIICKEYDVLYQINDYIYILNLKERGIKILLKELVQRGSLVNNRDKGKRYKNA